MNPEVIRAKLIAYLDEALSYALLVRGEKRAMLTGLRAYVGAAMPVSELEKLSPYIGPMRGEFLMSAEYPASFPIDDAGVVVSFLRGGGVGRNAAVKATWSLAGYGLSQFDFDGVRTFAASPMLSDEAAADLIESAAKPPVEGTVMGAPAIPWNLLLPVLLEIVKRLLTPSA